VNDNDLELIDLSLEGDSEAFGALVERYQDRLYNTMVRITGSRSDAADVVQEAFVQAYIKLDSFHKNSAFYTWLYRIAFNTAASGHRKKKPTVSIDQHRSDTGIDPVAKTESPSARLEQQETVDQVRAALDELQEEFRSVIVLKEIEGYHYDEIATILDLPTGTVKSRLFRARIQLKEILKKHLEKDLSREL